MEVIEVNNVILNILRARDDIADEPRVVRNFNTQCVFNRPDRSQRMHGRADAADPLSPDPRLARIAPAQDQFDAPEHRPGAPGIRDTALIDLRFNAKMALNAGYRIDHDSGHLSAPPSWSS
jgi:hypothetical protein